MNVLQISFTEIPASHHIPTLAGPMSEFTTNTSIPLSLSIFVILLVTFHRFFISRYYLLYTMPLLIYMEFEGLLP